MRPSPSLGSVSHIDGCVGRNATVHAVRLRSRGWRTQRSRAFRVAAKAQSSDEPALVVVGSINADMVLQIERMPEEGETLAAKTLQTFPGGKGANQAAAAGKLGCKTYFLGQVGKDNNAAFLRESLADASVDLTHLREVDGPSGSAVILLQPSGENSIIIVGGANVSNWEIKDDMKQVLRSGAALLLQREIPEEINTLVAEVAAEAGVRVIMDCGGVEGPISRELLRHVSILSPNETELARLTDLPTGSKEEAEAAARKLLEQGVREAVLVKRGGQGSLLVTASSDSIEQPILPADKAGKNPSIFGSAVVIVPDKCYCTTWSSEVFAEVVDTTGAGDCFTGAYAVALLEGREGSKALRFACAIPTCAPREAVGKTRAVDVRVDSCMLSLSLLTHILAQRWF